MNVTVPTAVKVAAGVAVTGVIALPLGMLLLSYFAARKAARAAVAAAPYVAEAAPVIMQAVPQAAPVVAAAGIVDAVRKARAGQPIPAGTADHVSQLVGALRTMPAKPSVTVPSAPASNLPARVPTEDPTVAPTERDPSRSFAGQLLGALRTIAPRPTALRVEVDGVPVRAELVAREEQKR